MLVLGNKCKKCNRVCNTVHFQQKFEYWTSGNDNIDKLIQNTQLSAHNDVKEVLEWVPYNKFENITYIEKIGVYKANWIDRCIYEWDNNDQYWVKHNKNITVTLKSLNSASNVTLNLTNEV
jgi:hypothetical protein